MKVRLTRLETSDQGTFGVLEVPGFPVKLYTGELPGRHNISNISCIPKGTYKGIWTYSPRFKQHMYLIEPVVKRAGIRIHSANFCGDLSKGYKRQLNGCVSLGLKLGWIDKQKAVLLSKPAIRQFEQFMKGREFTLKVEEKYARITD